MDIVKMDEAGLRGASNYQLWLGAGNTGTVADYLAWAASLAAGSTIYGSTADGLAATSDGDYFLVVGSGEAWATLYQDVSGSAVEIVELPSLAFLRSGTGATPLIRGLLLSSSSIVFLMDSLGEGTGATAYTSGYSYLIARSVLNANDRGADQNAGFGYHTIVNMANAVSEGGVTLSAGAAYSATGVVGSRLTLAAGEYVEITNRQLASIDVIYDADVSVGGSFVFKLNGTTIDTKAVSGTGLQTTFQTQLKSGYNTTSSDVVRIEATGASVVITGFQPYRQISAVPIIYTVADSGTAYQDYTSAADLTELAYYLNLFRSSSPKILYLGLGTNNLYNAGKALTPAAMVAQIALIVAGINSRCSTVSYVLQIPPQADEGTFPIIEAGYDYADYVTALLDYAETNGFSVVRQDLSGAEDFLSDGVHPNDSGHVIMAAKATDAMGIPYNPNTKSLTPTILSGSATYDPGSLATGASTAIQTMTVTGAAVGDLVRASFSSNLAGVRLTAWVSAASTVSYYFTNEAGANPTDLASGTVRVRVEKL